MNKIENIKYHQAITELEEIVSEIENENITIDELSIRVKRAALLIKSCKSILTKTSQDVNSILEDLQEDTQPGETPDHE